MAMTPAEFVEREAYGALWNYSPRRNGVLLYPVVDLARLQAEEEAAREAWLQGVKDRLGLICSGDEPASAPYQAIGLTERVDFYLEPRPPRENPCRVYWGSHGCDLERGHDGPHDCGCCDCGDAHPDAGDGVLCVATAPYYGPETRFYGEDAEPLGLLLVDP